MQLQVLSVLAVVVVAVVTVSVGTVSAGTLAVGIVSAWLLVSAVYDKTMTAMVAIMNVPKVATFISFDESDLLCVLEKKNIVKVSGDG